MSRGNNTGIGLGTRNKLSASLFFLPALLMLLTLAATPAEAQSAASWNKRGQAAEAREDYDAAWVAYKHAHDKKPKDLRYRTGFERVKIPAASQHIDRGRTLRQQSDWSGAISEFMRAAEIDPSNQTATQEIQITQAAQPPAQLAGAAATASMEQMSQQDAILKSIGSIAGPIELQPVSNDVQTLHMVEDVKVIYQAICKTAGLNVIFDPDYTSKRIPVDLTAVSLPDALRIVGAIAGTFYKPLTPNTIFVAQNTRTKRTDLDELAVQTFYLSNAAQAQDGNEILTAMRNLLDPSVKLYLVPSQNAIVMRATSDQLLLAQKLLNDLDQARPEVVVDVAVMEVNRDKVRNLGITLPTSIGLTPQVATTSSTSTTTTTTTSTSTTSAFTLNTLAHLNATNFAVTLSGGTLNALLTDTDTRILQNPRIRATDGQRATLKIGSKIPVATGSYSAGVSTTTTVGVQTQFTYLDVGVNIDMTPTVHQDREVTLKMKIEVSAQNGSVTISGVTEPIISQRVVEQVIQLKEDEPSILAGLIQTSDSKGVSGTPGLGEIPFFKYFFSTQSKEVQKDEIVFLLVPHIVREHVVTRLNSSPIDTGTGQSIELRRDLTPRAMAVSQPDTTPMRASGPETTAANAASAMIQQMSQQAQRQLTNPTAPAARVQAAQPTATAPISLNVLPATSNQSVGSTFQVAVLLNNGQDVSSVPMQIQYDARVLQLVSVDAGEFMGRDGQAARMDKTEEGNGLVSINTARPPNTKGVSGQGNLCTVTFKAIAPGDSNIALVKVAAKNSAQESMPTVGSQASVHVK
ncbi:general secretion pathway protein D [Granulicella rosea]|uniref:General secretion pathway protein D n=1 Tax=Granulicella rosea TaxID=474952 RepID=A0A239EWU9_9BACT|nr:cohesin domain-containing protein [Granulicella rosea]SNS49240.1 general secretion pathway protein D [Granulicella rosea]